MLADTNAEVVLGIPFLTLSYATVAFAEEKAYLAILHRRRGFVDYQMLKTTGSSK